ncbi:anoctamin-10, partial [Tremellales sp. Uapishka_1]
MSHQPPTASHSTAPGPPIPNRETSLSLQSNPYQVDLVLPFDISSKTKDERESIRQAYEELLRALEGEGGLRLATRVGRGGKGQEEVWVFVGAGEEKIDELVEKESLLDESHSLPAHSHPTPPSSATRLRLLHSLLTCPPLQNGLGITPGEGKWKRVKSIMALHDEESDQRWVERWTTGGDWQVGLLSGMGETGSKLGDHQPPPVHLYFAFLTTYTLSLLPLSVISTLFYLFTPKDSYPPLYAVVLALYSTIFVAYWRITERKLAVRWGTRGCESVAVSRLRPEYVASVGLLNSGSNAVDAIREGDDLKRDAKVALSVPVIAACGVGLGCVLSGIFLLEAFVGAVYEGTGKEVVPLVPTVLFAIVIPQIVAAYNALAKALVKWEDHPTSVGEDKSLTAKTFAMNAIVAYLGLYLTAFVYVPFGSVIMGQVQSHMSTYQGRHVNIASSPEKAGLGPRTSGERQRGIKAGRLKGQLFAYTVTNQVINAILELAMPFVKRFVSDWRAGKTTIKEAIEKRGHYNEEKGPAKTEEDLEKRFMDKVERELALPEYSLFTDYAEMATQFGYVTIWSIVWPLAPVFALLNNYVELRSDALKICKHVRRPLGERVETIGSWLETLSIITWLGAITNATLIYLFRPSATLYGQTPNPNIPSTPGSAHLLLMMETYHASPALKTVLPTLIPLALVALAASHGFIVLRWLIDGIMERTLWRGSAEEIQVQKMSARKVNVSKVEKRNYGELNGGFWNGGEEGAREIGKIGKAE